MLLPGRRVQPSIPCFPGWVLFFKLDLVLGKKSDAAVPVPGNTRRAVAAGGFRDHRIRECFEVEGTQRDHPV